MRARHRPAPAPLRRLGLAVAAALVGGLGVGSAAGQPLLYWSDLAQTKIERADLDGSGSTAIVTALDFGLEGIAIDAGAGKVYWVHPPSDTIRRAVLPACRLTTDAGVEVLIAAATPTGLHSVALDLAAGKMYFGDGKDIRKANLDGSGDQVIYTSPSVLALPLSGIAVDSAGGKLYWAENSGSFAGPQVKRADLDGSKVENLASNQGGLTDVALDPAGGKVYWSRIGAGSGVYRANLDGTSPEFINSGSGWAVGVDPSAGKVYWQATFGIRRSDLDGSNEEDFAGTSLTVVDMAVELSSGRLYFTTSEGLEHAELTDGSVRGVDFAPLSPEPRGLAVDLPAGHLYYAGGTASRTLLDGTCREDVGAVAEAEDVVVDVAEDKVYWVQGSDDTIRRANLDGTGAELLVSGPLDPERLALDLAAGKLYWTNVFSSKIQRANLDGSSIEDIVTTGLFTPVGIAIDPLGQKLYWSDTGTDKIQRAELDGSGIQDLVATGLSQANDLDLDPVGGKMYWIDRGNGTLRRANLDGSGVETLLTGLVDPGALALALFPTCGNGSVDPGEECDDGNTDAKDCCSELCQFESGPGVPPCCSAGLCQVGQPCGAACFGSGACVVGGMSADCLCLPVP